jgi:Aconitase X
LSANDEAMLAGRGGEAAALVMRVVVAMARLSGASELLDITGAHIDACLFHGYAGLDFAGCWYAAERGCGSRRRSTCRHWTCCTGTATAGTRIPPPPPPAD